MDRPRTGVASRAALAKIGRVAAVVALVVAALGWASWAFGVEELTRVYPTWPLMVPWAALWLAALASAILLQSGHPSRARVWAGRSVAIVAAAVALAVLVEYATGRSLGLDEWWFGAAERALQSSWPGRPSPQTAVSVVLLAPAIAAIRSDRRWSHLVFPACVIGGGLIPLVMLAGYLFGATALVVVGRSTGMALLNALGLLLIVVATVVSRPDRAPLAWLISRPDRGALMRLYGLAVGFPIVVGLLRLLFLALGQSDNVAFAVSVLICVALACVIGFRLRRGEQDLLIEKEQLAQERADAEARYRILADNAVDIIVHLRGSEVVWISPSAEAALGGPAEKWVGADFYSYFHPDDLPTLAAAMERVTVGESAHRRFRLRAFDGDYHWVDGHAKPYVDAGGEADGVIGALRIVDDRVEVEQQLERLARFDALTGLANRGEAIARLEAALEHPPSLGVHLGILFCDVDRFKDINDSWGHGTGDAVLATLAARIRECVRQGDTVGRTGGDEILVVLPGLRGIDQLSLISETIRSRAAEPIQEAGTAIHATLSIGATLAVPGETVSCVIARADAAMYRAKSGDRNTVVLAEPSQPSRSTAR